MLTIKQALTVTTRRAVPPWSISEWRTIFNVGQGQPLSVRTIIEEIENRKLFLFLEVRGLSLFRNAHSLGEVLAQWKDAPGPTRTDLLSLAAQLSPHGVSIRFLSPDRRIIGLSGTTGQAGGVQGIRLTENVEGGLQHIAEGAAISGAVAIGISPLNPSFLVVGVALESFAAGIEIGLAICDLTTLCSPAEPGQPPPPKQTVSSDDTDVYGEVPPGVDAGQVRDLGEIDVIDLGDLPDVPPPPDGGGGP